MSEYQYYEFLAIDRPLDKEQMAELRALSTRATITPTRFQNVYNFGDFRGNPNKLMDRYFDAFVYVANWGTHWLMLKLPIRLLDDAVASRYEVEDRFETRLSGENIVLSFRSEEEGGDWEAGEEWMPSLVSLRADLASGDLRSLYLGWLAGARDAELTEEVEPPVPPGLGSLSAPLRSLADFLRLDEDLIAEAASRSAPAAAEPARPDFERWLRALPANEKDDILLRLMADAAPTLRAELRQRFRRERSPFGATDSSRAIAGRTVASLLAAAEARGERRRREEAAREARMRAIREREQALARARYLDGLVGREADLWQRVERHVESKRSGEYDEAIQRLLDLRDLAERAGASEQFAVQLADLRARHATKSAFIRRMVAAGLE